MQFRNFDYLQCVLFSVLYMRKTPIQQGTRQQVIILYICTVDASVYCKTGYLAPDVKFSVVCFLLLVPPRPKMTLTYVVYICCDISLAKGHIGSMGRWYISKINLNTRN